MLSIECPCGRARAGCDYHDPTLQPGYIQNKSIGVYPTTLSNDVIKTLHDASLVISKILSRYGNVKPRQLITDGAWHFGTDNFGEWYILKVPRGYSESARQMKVVI